jgi:hypothetical protein
LREKWQSRWNRRVEAQEAAKARAAALAEEQAQLAVAAEDEEEDEQLPTGASTAAARRSSYGGCGGEQLQLQLQAHDLWVCGLAAWARECPDLIKLQLADNIPVPEAYRLPESYWAEKHLRAVTEAAAEPAAQPEEPGAAACRNSAQQVQDQPTHVAPASADGGKSLQEQGEQQQQQQQEEGEGEKKKKLKPLEKPVDFVAELAQAVAAVKGLVDASAAAASCGLSVRCDDTCAVLQEGWRVVQEVDWELDRYDKFAKWVPKRAQNVSLQAVLQQLQVPREYGSACEAGNAAGA